MLAVAELQERFMSFATNFRSDSTVLIQGITESIGAVHAPRMLDYGTRIVAGVSPGHWGEERYGIPIFDMVEQAIAKVGQVDTTVIVVPPYQVLDAALEAIDAGIRQIILITEGVPPLDMVSLCRKAESTATLLVGSNSPGIIVPGQLLLGTYPTEFYTPGSVGLISRSSTLMFEVALALTGAGFGQSIGVGVGGDRIVGSSLQQWLQILNADEHTKAIVLLGEIGGTGEELAAQYIATAIDKPVIAYLAGRTAPREQVIGHAGALITNQITSGRDIGTAESKIAAFNQAKILVADRPSQIPDLIRKALPVTDRQASL
jgi:succinyl-CoA synthetase alpha subunit